MVLFTLAKKYPQLFLVLSVLQIVHNKFSWYKHSGWQVLLKRTEEDQPADVDYPFREDIFSELLRTFKSNIVTSFPFALQALEFHDLVEYQKRLLYALRKENGEARLAVDETNPQFTTSLNEYYEKYIVKKA
jgi:hypothetical protein